jgi:tetratricopeptide (TPR) repeat protein
MKPCFLVVGALLSMLIPAGLLARADRTPEAAASDRQSQGAAEQQSPPAPSPGDQKQLKAKAKQLVAEGNALEEQGKLLEARDKFIDAEGVISTSEARDALSRVHDAIQQDVASAISEAHRAFDAGKIQDSISQLQRALGEDPSNPAAHFDLALCYAKLSDRSDAVAHLDLAAASLKHEKQNDQLLELRSATLMDVGAPASASEVNKPLADFNAAFLESDRAPGDAQTGTDPKTATEPHNLCEQTANLQKNFPDNPAVIFNTAKCAEEDGRLADAARWLGDYARLAPTALDRSDALVLEAEAASLAALPGDSGAVVRQHFATAMRYLDYRRYDRALAEYVAAETALPNFPLTQWQLALIYEAYGDVEHARERFAHFKQLEPDPQKQNDAQLHLDSLAGRRADYDGMIEDAQDMLSELLTRAMGLDLEGVKHKAKLSRHARHHASRRYKEAANASEKLSPAYVDRQLTSAREILELATEIFPLGAEANEMLALIYLEGNNWPAALRCFDAVAAQGFPVSFYAQENSAHDPRMVHGTKAEVGNNTMRLVYLSNYNNDKKIAEAPDVAAGDDDLGNLVVDAAEPPDLEAGAQTIAASDLLGVSTDKNFVVLKTKTDQIYLAPVYMLAAPPFEGPAARALGNEYTRLFIRYLGYEQAKLGKEGMTSGEKFKLGMSIAMIGLSVAGTVETMGLGGVSAYGAGLRAADLVHALQVYRSAKMGLDIAKLTYRGSSLLGTLSVDTKTLEHAGQDQRRAIDGIRFRMIPSQPLQLKFREKF